MRDSVNLKKGALINLNGKNLSGRKEPCQGKKALIVVSAWTAEQSVVLGQVKCEEKSNEITALPELLKILMLKGCIVTINAMGCQKEIVGEIINKGADYLIAVKGNQGNLHKDINDYLDWAERIKFKDIKYELLCNGVRKRPRATGRKMLLGDGRN